MASGSIASNLSAIFDGLVDIPTPARSAVSRLLGFDKAERLYASLQGAQDDRLPERLIKRLSVTVCAAERDLEQIPRRGPVIIVANHPFGILEGAVLATLLMRVRPDLKFLGNEMLSNIPEISDLLIPVDAMRTGAARKNFAGLRRAMEFLQEGGCLAVFPAGEVAHYHARDRAIVDSPWHPAIARMVETLSRRGIPVSTVPVHIGGANSLLFQFLGLISPKLRTALLVRELLNKRNRFVEVRVGTPVSNKKLLEIATPKERTEYLRWRTELLANRLDYKPRTSRPLSNRVRKQPHEIAHAELPGLMAKEIARLATDQLLAKTGDLEVYIAAAEAIPVTLREIGRLRELTFRSVGEGTGQSIDLDRFDVEYLHLFVWHAARTEVVGAYRLAGTDVVRNLYTATLFKYDRRFLDGTGPALELGRSFVRAEYQKGFAPLLALWKGIGTWVARNPKYKILFGPVSISNQYQAVSRELMVAFLERSASLPDWMGRNLANLVSNRNPLRRPGKLTLPESGFDVEDLSDVISDLEPSRNGIPVLLRQYLKLGGKLLGFNVDPEFSNALDGLILVDLCKTEPRLLERYLGKRAAAEFLGYWQKHDSDSRLV
jgi:putative hemolysin